MSSEVEIKAARVTGPIASTDATWRKGVIRVALDGNAQSVALPTTGALPNKDATISGRYIRLLVMGANAQVAQGLGSAPSINLNEVSAGGPPLVPDVNSGATFVNGVPDQFELDAACTHIGFRGDGGAAGYIEFYVSDKMNKG